MRRLRQCLTQPLTSLEENAVRHDIVEAFCCAEGFLGMVEGHFRHVPDLEKLAPWLLCTTPRVLLGVAAVVVELSTYEGIHDAAILSTLAEPLRAFIANFVGFCDLVQQSVDLKQAEHRTYCVSSSFHEPLGTFSSQRANSGTQMEAQRQEADAQLGLTATCRRAHNQQSAQQCEKLFAVAPAYCSVVERLGETTGSIFCLFAERVKLRRTNSKAIDSSLRYVLGAKGEEDFIAGASENLPKLHIANGCAGWV